MKIVLDTSWPQPRWRGELRRIDRRAAELAAGGSELRDPWHPLSYPMECEMVSERVERLEAERGASGGRLVPWRRRR